MRQHDVEYKRSSERASHTYPNDGVAGRWHGRWSTVEETKDEMVLGIAVESSWLKARGEIAIVDVCVRPSHDGIIVHESFDVSDCQWIHVSSQSCEQLAVLEQRGFARAMQHVVVSSSSTSSGLSRRVSG